MLRPGYHKVFLPEGRVTQRSSEDGQMTWNPWFPGEFRVRTVLASLVEGSLFAQILEDYPSLMSLHFDADALDEYRGAIRCYARVARDLRNR